MTIEVVCDTCGSELEEQAPRYGNRGAVRFLPCEICLESAHSEGCKDGHNEGYEVGYEAGIMAGEQAVRDDVKSMLQIVKEESTQ